MRSKASWMFRMSLSLIFPVLFASCGHLTISPPVRSASQCILKWDQVNNPAVSEYRITVWPDQNTSNTPKQTHRVQAPNTTVPCSIAGANRDGTWWATVQACTKKEVCSEPSAPFTFVVSAK